MSVLETTACRGCGEPMSDVDGDGADMHLVCPRNLTLRVMPEFPEGTTLEQQQRVLTLARDCKATEIDVKAWTPVPCPFCGTRLPGQAVIDMQIECPAHRPGHWLYVVVDRLDGGEFHAGIDVDGTAHS